MQWLQCLELTSPSSSPQKLNPIRRHTWLRSELQLLILRWVVLDLQVTSSQKDLRVCPNPAEDQRLWFQLWLLLNQIQNDISSWLDSISILVSIPGWMRVYLTKQLLFYHLMNLSEEALTLVSIWSKMNRGDFLFI